MLLHIYLMMWTSVPATPRDSRDKDIHKILMDLYRNPKCLRFQDFSKMCCPVKPAFMNCRFCNSSDLLLHARSPRVKCEGSRLSDCCRPETADTEYESRTRENCEPNLRYRICIITNKPLSASGCK